MFSILSENFPPFSSNFKLSSALFQFASLKLIVWERAKTPDYGIGLGYWCIIRLWLVTCKFHYQFKLYIVYENLFRKVEQYMAVMALSIFIVPSRDMVPLYRKSIQGTRSTVPYLTSSSTYQTYCGSLRTNQ